MTKNLLLSIETSPTYKSYLKQLDSCNYSAKSKYLKDRASALCSIVDDNSEYINYGCSRVAIKFDSLVAKIAISKDDANSRERDLLALIVKQGKVNLLKHLCPILAHNEYINIVPLCKPVSEEDTLDVNEIDTDLICEIIDEFLEMGIEFTDVDSAEQWGYLGDTLVLLDYAEWYYSD